ncbi:hypothetical protein AYR66_08795 [Noviherbaspirillum denitrificans]|uniref:ATP-grasp domain-containing protein n=1 Tax=Noviherbaspirillum denitrificans TaxID=1968433 RepID=A0A254TAK5_9BURK|nr:hypothetical protein AYR66_08795 [Noviherbaspirillum denitrificans]
MTRQGLQSEADSLRLLKEAGVPVVDFAVCGSADEAESAFRSFGGAVVVKGCAADVPHKSEHGLVHLNLKSVDEVRRAAQDCLAVLDSLGSSNPAVVVAPMVRGVHELMLGATVDPVFGPAVMIGEGGTLVEIRRDTVTLLAPFTESEARDALRGLRIAPLLDGYRDRPPLDVGALARAAASLGDFVWRHRDNIHSVDINPVMAMRDGGGVVAVDAVVEFSEGGRHG